MIDTENWVKAKEGLAHRDVSTRIYIAVERQTDLASFLQAVRASTTVDPDEQARQFANGLVGLLRDHLSASDCDALARVFAHELGKWGRRCNPQIGLRMLDRLAATVADERRKLAIELQHLDG